MPSPRLNLLETTFTFANVSLILPSIFSCELFKLEFNFKSASRLSKLILPDVWLIATGIPLSFIVFENSSKLPFANRFLLKTISLGSLT